MTEMDRAREARIRLVAARDFIARAIRAVDGPEPDWAYCAALIDMAGDVMPYVKGEARDEG